MGGAAREGPADAITARSVYVKLFTKEDYPHHVFGLHKLLGLGCLLHYIFRFALVPFKDDMWFSASWTTAATLGMHAVLSLSSLIFKIPKKRIVEGSRIWPEYRLHSIIFACRSLACMALLWVEQRNEWAPLYWGNAAIVMSTLIAADVASWSVGEASRSSTIRDLDAPPALQFFFSVMQFHATAGCLVGVRRYSTQFVYVWIIQFTAFLMTLRRKNLAPHRPLVRIYGVMLTFGFVIATLDALSANSWAFVNTVANTAAIGRLGCRIDKYVLWLIMAAFCSFARQTVVPGNPLGHLAQLWPYTWALSVVGVLLMGKRRLSEVAAKEKAAGKAK
ncbi:hypothetical protein AB1Y20_014908 [Prymnesium parvum]|uniref:Uncharacterized protein n=1 Tax=Prymnesium parvum TaxID=97485 RepID=A0AB34JZT7_PRYPA